MKKSKTKKLKRQWYCWYCGQPVPDKNGSFVLWSLNERIDRIFIICFEKNCVDAVRTSDGVAVFLQGKENKLYDF